MIASLADLLHPHDPGLLLAAASDNRRLLLRTGRAAAFARLLPWERLNDLITPDRLLAGDVEFARDGMILPPEMTIVRPRGRAAMRLNTQAIEQYCRQGISVIIKSLQRLDTGIECLNAIVEREFRAVVHANLYAGFGGGGAFKPHWDEHDVLVLHLQGRKQWQCWGQPWAAPTERSKFPVPKDLGHPEWEAVLEPGDTLYLPRGEVHAAWVVDGGDSLHLTVGIAPPRIEALTAAMARACEAEPLGRQNLPILAEAGDRDAWMAAAKLLLHRAVDNLDLDQVLTALDRAREPLPPGFPGFARRLAAGTIVTSTLPRRLPLSAEIGGGSIEVRAGSRTWTIDSTERDVLVQVQRHHSRSLAELLDVLAPTDETAVRQAVQKLVGKGLAKLLGGVAPPA